MSTEKKGGQFLHRLLSDDIGQFVPVLLSLLVIWAYFAATEPAFLSARNMHFLFMQSAVVATLAVGITLVLLIGEIDLAIATVSGVAAAVLAVLLLEHGVPTAPALLAGLATGAVLGFAQGMVVAYVGIPSFVVTLAGLLGFQGLMQKVMGRSGAINVDDAFIRGLTTVTFPDWLGWLIAALLVAVIAVIVIAAAARRKKRGLEAKSGGALLLRVALFAAPVLAVVATLNAYRGVPLLLLLLGAIVTLLWCITVFTPFGRYLFAIGGNAESARRAGIPVLKIRVAAFALAGLFAGIGGIVGASRYTSVSFNAFAGGPLLLEAIGAAVIGGTSLFGGRGSIWNAVLGALVIGSLGNGLDLSGAGAAEKLMFSGGILLIAVSIDAVTRGGAQKRR